MKTEVLSNNWSTLRKFTYEYQKSNGIIETHSREAYDGGNGATIMLYNKAQRTVILTRQFRLTTFINGNLDGMLIEACAGLLDRDHPEDCIRRETAEETGYQVNAIQKVFEAYMSPGSVTELLYFFIAEYATSMKVNEGGGLAHEQEDIQVLELGIEQAMAMVKNGEIKDAKTIMLLQYLLLENLL